MTLTKEQLNQVKQFAKENGLNAKLIIKEFSPAFWATRCGSSIEGYISFIFGYKSTSDINFWLQSHKNIMAGKAGASHFS